ncbi:MAG: efflux RND transporter periplasmic adaptor subunit [Xanthobacteraceae bacterium]
MNERVSAETVQERPDKLVQFPRETPPPKKLGPRTRTYWFIAALGALLLVAAVAGWWSWGTSSPTQYTMAEVTRGPIARTVTATGTVNPELTIIVGTYVSGVIQELFCDYNTVVKKGQVCAKIDPRPYQTIVDQSKANLAVAQAQLAKDKANLTYTKVRYERTARLAQTHATSQDAVDAAKSNYEQAQAQILFDEATIQQRQAMLDAALVNLGYANIVSPVDGVVVSRNVTVGQTVAASFQTPTLFLIATDLTKMQVDTNVSESDIGGVKIGDPGTFTVDAFSNRTFRGKVSQVRQSPQTVQNVVTYDVVVSVDNSDLALKPGMTAAVQIVVDQRADVLRVPTQALRYAPSAVGSTGKGLRSHPAPSAAGANEAQVWVLRGGRPTAIRITLGLEDDHFTEIVSGDLKPGDEVITAEQSGGAKPAPAPRLRF